MKMASVQGKSLIDMHNNTSFHINTFIGHDFVFCPTILTIMNKKHTLEVGVFGYVGENFDRNKENK